MASEARPLPDRLRGFAAACEDRSPLYAHLARRAADDPEVAELLTAAPTAGLAHPTLLFAAVHDLVLAGDAPDLAAWYPSAGGRRTLADADPWPTFRRTVLTHRAAVEHRVGTRRTQTNEVGRSSALLVALRWVQQSVARPLAWLDVGTSAGLNLRLEHYRHEFVGDAATRVLGPEDARVRLRCEVTGVPPLDAVPDVGWRSGLDAAPVDVTDPRERAWLQACVWPEQIDRLQRLRAALDVATADPVPLHTGDAVDALAEVAAAAPADAHLVVTHSWVLAYLEPDARKAFEAALAELGSRRDLDRIGMESGGLVPGTVRDGRARSWLGRSAWRDGRREDQVAAEVDDHGRWLTWEPGPARPIA
ncbi:DUF2332 domain-containing protein [Egicoccus sp. AB-alg2]|uniref:DUF2332 domain-containing protein n=1 Tax=Egicoccus sp. AB-alg2 TaxID=3242693 RepID=UPI00359CFB96